MEMGVWRCTLCDYATRKKTHVREHIECKHVDDGQFYNCKFCPKAVKSRNSLRRHVGQAHPQVKASNENLY